jgi:hypothetical protein
VDEIAELLQNLGMVRTALSWMNMHSFGLIN